MRTNQSAYRVTFSANGGPARKCLGMTGGDADSEETKIAAGGMETEEAQGGRPTVTNPVFRIKYDPAIDDLHALRALRGWAPGVGNRQKLDQHKNPAGDADVFTGVIKRVSVVEFDANGTNPDIYEVELSADGTIG